MGSDHHTPYQNSITRFVAEDMNFPLDQIDNAITSLSGEVDFHYFGSGESSVEDSDTLRIWDDSNGKYKVVNRGDFLAGGTHPYDIGLYISGEVSGGSFLVEYPMPRTVSFAIDMGNSQARAGVLATSDAVFGIRKDGSQFATITFNPSGENATFSGEAQTFVTGEVLTVVSPDPADTTLAGVSFSLAGTRGG